MSCLGPNYNPVPPRAWSRLDSPCQYVPKSSELNNLKNPVYFPYLKKFVPYSQLAAEYQMLNKGNVLQYKANSSNLSKWQKYNEIAKGKWVNRNTTWAIQSQTYANPNTTSLKRVNYKNITLDGVPTNLPLTCPPNYIIEPKLYNMLPVNKLYDPVEVLLPPEPETYPPSNPPTIPDVVPEPVLEESLIVIPDGGKLVGNIQENICTGEIYSYSPPQYCYPSSGSNVPGRVIDLCWNNGIQPWYPKQRLVMPTSGDKFPQGYKFFKPA